MKDDEITNIESLVESGRYHDALAIAQSRIAECPERAKLWADKGWILFRIEDFSAAIAAFTAALRLHPRAATTLFFRAQCKEKIGDLQGALDDYRASISIKPMADAMLNIGLILKYTGDSLAARESFRNALELEPTNELASTLLNESDSPPQAPRG